MIRVEIVDEPERRGSFRYRVSALGVEGQSRQPLLDACRQIERMGGDTKQAVGLFRAGRSKPDITCRSVEAGAALTVTEPSDGRIRFARYQRFDAVKLGVGELTATRENAVPCNQSFDPMRPFLCDGSIGERR